jgi:capsular exopolysaccharide synthesis family protein
MPFGAAGARGPDVLQAGFDQTWLLNCLRRRWLSSLLLGALIGAGFGVLLLWLFPESASTRAYLQVKVKGDANVFDEQRLTPAEIEKRTMTQLSLIKSTFVLRNALTRADVAPLQAVRDQGNLEDAVQWLLEDLQVSFPNDGEIMEVRYDGEEDPAEMVTIVQAVVDSYIKQAVYEERDRILKQRESLKDVLREVNTRLRRKKQDYEDLAATQTSAHSPTAEPEIQRLTREQGDLQREISKIKGQLLDVRVFRDVAIRQADSPTALEAQVQQALADDPLIKEYQAELFNLQRQLMMVQGRSKNPNSRDVKMIAGAMQSTQMQLEQYKANSERELRAQLKRIPNEGLQAVMIEHKIRSEELQAELQELEQKVADNDARILELGARNPELDMLLAEIEGEAQIAADLDRKLASWNVDADAQTGQITELNPAHASENINTIERFSIAGVGSVLGFVLTAYGIALLEFGRRRVNGPTNLDEGLGIRVLGVLPATTARKSLLSNSLTGAQAAEAADNVRAAIMHSRQSHQVILVTSPDPLEGSTTVAANLARSFARAGRRTLLIDGDLRDPALHKLLDLPLDNGFCELLRSEVDAADAVRPTKQEGLYFLSAGHCNVDAIQILATDQPQPVFDQLRSQFDYIVIDTAPVLGLADSVSLGQYADGAIISVLRDHSGLRETHKAAEALRSMGIEVLGSVVNGVPMKADRRVVHLLKTTKARQAKLPSKSETVTLDEESE